MNQKIYVGNLNYDTTEEDLKSIFAEYGTVESVNIIKDKFTGKSKGFAFIEMGDEDSAQQAINGMDQQEILGRRIKVDKARERKRDSF